MKNNERTEWPRRASEVRVPDGRVGSVAGYDTNPNRVMVRFSHHGTVEQKWFALEEVKAVR